jgi:NADPH2:quinone reductase
MRGILVEDLGGPDSLRLATVEEPRGAHQLADGVRLLVEVHAAGISFPDLLQSRGEYQFSTPPPFVSGGEVAGIVLEADPGCGFEPGDRVAGMTVWGAMAERAQAIPRFTMRLPDSVDFTTGAALYLNYTTAWFAIERAAVQPGEAVLVHGAAGGVGTAALQLLALRGARPIAVVSDAEKEEVARRMGASAVLRSDGDWLGGTRELTDGQGAAVVLDPVGGDRFVDSLRALDTGGRLIVIGFAGGGIPTIKANRLLLGNLTVIGIAYDPMDRRFPGTLARISEAVSGLAEAGQIAPLVGRRLPFERGAEALAILDRREAIGKVVVEVAG